MITGAQIRMAAAALRWSRVDLARESGLGWRTCQRLVSVDGVPPGRASSVAAVQAACELAGVEFQEADNGGPGVRLVKPRKRAARTKATRSMKKATKRTK